MAVISKDLGPVSAYAVAVANGFTGTEAEWEQYIANASTAAQSAAGSATAAASSASAAAQSATAAAASQVAAAGSETEAANYALVAGNHAMAAAASATAAETAETGAETAQAAAEAAQAAAEAVAESIPEDYTELTEEVGSLKSAVNPRPATIVDPIVFTAGRGINADTGGQPQNSDLCNTDYIDISAYSAIIYPRMKYTSTPSTKTGIAFYDSDKTYISGVRALYGQSEIGYVYEQETVPASAKYVRLFKFAIITDDLYLRNPGVIVSDGIVENTERIDAMDTEIAGIESDVTDLREDVIGITGTDQTIAIPLTGAGNIVQNYYISNGGEDRAANGFDRTVPIHVYKYDVITAKVKSYNTGTEANKPSIISTYDSTNQTYTGLVPTTSADLTTYTYTVPAEMDIVISFLRDASNEASIARHIHGTLEALLSPASKWVCFGDSITGKYSGKCIPDMMADRFNCTVYNVAFPGTRATKRTADNNYKYFDFPSLADAIVAGDFTDQDDHLADTESIYPTRLATLKSIDFSEVTNAYFCYGTNDFNGSITPAATAEKLIENIQKILTAYPNITPVILTPMFRFHTVDDEVEFLDEWRNSGANATLIDYITDIETAAAEAYIPCVNLLKTLGITKQNYLKYFSASDGTHPSAAGIIIIGGNVAAMLDYLNKKD